MHITIIMVVTYIVCCFRIATAPWRYWQLNAHYFSNEQGVFSKLSLDKLIPERWRLFQNIDTETLNPTRFPVFLKPEWGQNAHGIHRADNEKQLGKLRARLAASPQRYLLQEAAPGKREFELFSIDANREDSKHDIFTVTEAVNQSEKYPINSKYNRSTRYVDITGQFSDEQQSQLSSYLSEVGKFGISRMSVRANSIEEMVAGKFHVIEINLFLPMPINLLDSSLSWSDKWRFILPAMMSLAQATRLIKPVEKPQPIFARMMMYGRRKQAAAAHRKEQLLAWANATLSLDIYRYTPAFSPLKSLKALIYKWVSQKYMAGCSNYNSLQVRKASRSKLQARDMFYQHDIPHAKGTLFYNPFTAHKFAKEHGFPLCIKPNVSGFSRGSHFPITNYKQLWKAALSVKIWWPSSIVEQYLLGANYRVLATDKDMVSVIRRYPPFVDGNGRDSIAKLIENENATREEMGLHPTIYPIPASSATVGYLAKSDRTLNTVPEAGERVYTFNRVALAPGGIVEVINQSAIPEANRELFFRVIKAFDARLFGIDVIFEESIEKDYREQRCIFLEVNSRPYTRMHSYPRYGQRENLDDFYAQMDALDIADTDTY